MLNEQFENELVDTTLKTLDLKKTNINNFNIIQVEYENLDNENVAYATLEQDIARAWNFLKITHTIEKTKINYLENDYNFSRDEELQKNMIVYFSRPYINCVVSIRAIIASHKNKRRISNHELLIFDFDDYNYNRFANFIRKYHNHRDATFNFYYNIFTLDLVKAYKNKEVKKKKMYAASEVIYSTSILPIDLDNYTLEEYKQIRNFFLDRDIIPIEVFSGHGFHLIIRIEPCLDSKILVKWLYLLSLYGIKGDTHCVDAGRTLRLPFFYNIKPKEYNKASKATIIEGERNVPIYSLNELFNKLDKDYTTFELPQKVSTINNTQNKITKKCKLKVDTINVTNCNLENLYPMLNIKILPKGIVNMLKGFIQGTTYYQLMCLTLYFKKSNMTYNEIIDIVHIIESINGNYWNTWNVDDMTLYFYENTYGVGKNELNLLQNKFGMIAFPVNKNSYKIPFGIMKPAEMKLYMFLLLNGSCKKSVITKELGFSRNRIYKIIENSKVIVKNGLLYEAMDIRVKNYLFLNKEEVEKYLKWNENEIVVFLYLKYRCGENCTIQTSIPSIEKATLLKRTSITLTINNLCNKKILEVFYCNLIDKNNRQSNIYKILEE